MMAVLGTEPELEQILQNIAASPIDATRDDVENVSMDILSRSVAVWKHNEANVEDLTQELMALEAQHMVEITKSAHDAVSMNDQLEQQRWEQSQMKLVSVEEKLEQSTRRLDDIVGKQESQAKERRSNAMHLSEQVETACKPFNIQICLSKINWKWKSFSMNQWRLLDSRMSHLTLWEWILR
jgi:hypothetical protein